MPPKLGEWIERIKGVEREFRVGGVAAQLLGEHLRANPAMLDILNLRHRDAARFKANLERTYLVRLYAEFEAGLREAWRLEFGRSSFPTMEVLIDLFGTLCDMSPNVVTAVHQVRNYRNDIVHDVRAGVPPVSLDLARHQLCAYFAWLPRDW